MKLRKLEIDYSLDITERGFKISISFLGLENNKWIVVVVQTESTELFKHRQNIFTLEFAQFDITIGYLGREVKEKQSNDCTYISQPQVLSSRSDLKITGLGINIHNVIDATRIRSLWSQKSSESRELCKTQIYRMWEETNVLIKI